MNLLGLCVLSAAVLAAAPLPAQEASLTARLNQLLLRESNGHSPTDAEIAAAATPAGAPGPADLHTAVPLLAKALASPDAPARTFALNMLVGLETPGSDPSRDMTSPPPADDAPAPQVQTAFPSSTAAALTPILAQIAAHLTDDVPANRLLTTAVLGGFTPDPPAATFPPLYSFLKREDAIGPVGLAVVDDLLGFGPLSAETSAAVARYLKRPDQTGDSRANLVDAVATHPNQSQVLNAAVLALLNADDPTLRARVILSLPGLDLAPEVYAETRTRVQQMVDNSSENLQVVNAAKAVAPCWTAVKMTTGCPVYP